MPGLLIKDLPRSLHRRLVERARANRRSMANEALTILEAALDDRAGAPSLQEVDAMRVRGRRALTPRLLDAARRGRP
jgi:plasmid stability protein